MMTRLRILVSFAAAFIFIVCWSLAWAEADRTNNENDILIYIRKLDNVTTYEVIRTN